MSDGQTKLPELRAPNTSPLTLPNGFSRRQIAAAISPDIQKLTLFPTEKCNFRCVYCYEDFEIGKMSPELQRSIELLVERRITQLKQLHFSWFGGEPLLAKDVVLRLLRHADKLCREYGVGFLSGMTTNAYLLDFALAEELLSLRQTFYQITLDGLGDEHDKLRRRADGEGTFDRIWSNLQAMKGLAGKFDCQIRVHVRHDNIKNLELLMREIRTEFGSDDRYRIDFQHLRDMGGTGGKTVQNALSLAELFEVQRHLTSVYLGQGSATSQQKRHDDLPSLPATDIPAQYVAESAGSRSREELQANEPYICYATKPNNLTIRANGRVGKCTVALDDARNDIGYLDEKGHLIVDQEKHKLWFRGLETLDLVSSGCPMKGMPQYEGERLMPTQPIQWLNKSTM